MNNNFEYFITTDKYDADIWCYILYKIDIKTNNVEIVSLERHKNHELFNKEIDNLIKKYNATLIETL